jgi:hypothetical protein
MKSRSSLGQHLRFAGKGEQTGSHIWLSRFDRHHFKELRLPQRLGERDESLGMDLSRPMK